MSFLTPRELVVGSVELNSLPEVYTRINDLVDDPYCSAEDVSRVASQDPSLTTRLLKLVNSPFYGFASTIDTVSRAIAVIGMRELRDLVLATSVTRMFKGIPSDLVDMTQFWKQSIYCGLIARALSRQRDAAHGERMFVAGMLHKIGALILYKKIPELSRESLSRVQFNNEVLYLVENEVIGFNHADVGGELIRQWKLPANLVAAVAHHLSPKDKGDNSSETSTVHLANLITTAIRPEHKEVIPPLDPTAWDIAGCPPELLDAVIEEANTQLSSTYALIRCDH